MTGNISRYCMRCNVKAHGTYNGGSHETNEHDEWLERQRRKAAEGLTGTKENR